jgi:hypothetical protein
MNQVEQWFRIWQRKRLTIVDMASKAELAEKLQQFIAQWKEQAHPFNWTKRSVAKVMANCQLGSGVAKGTRPLTDEINDPLQCGVVLSNKIRSPTSSMGAFVTVDGLALQVA